MRQHGTSDTFSRQSQQWVHHFQSNLDHMDHVPWGRDRPLNDSERRAISKSIAVFQLGENSEGNAFRRGGRVYATRTGDFAYLEALTLFIKEEQRHSAALGRFTFHTRPSFSHVQITMYPISTCHQRSPKGAEAGNA